MTRAEFIRFLMETLIPDLIESGMDATAEDFETAIEFLQDDRDLLCDLVEAFDLDDQSHYTRAQRRALRSARKALTGKA